MATRHRPEDLTNFPASTMDIFPTLIEIAKLDPMSINAIGDGISIAHVFDSEPARRDRPSAAASPGSTTTTS